MSNQATVSAIPGPATVPTGVAYITGQIRFKSKAITTKSGRLFLTVIALPAPDEFTSPAILELYDGFSIVEIDAKRAINSKGDGRGPVKEVLIR